MEKLIETNEVFLAEQVPHDQMRLAFLDLTDSIKKWRLLSYLGWNDIRMRYRGSVLGPLWITASMLIFIGAFSIVYSRLFHQTLTEYVPFLTVGYLVWLFISSVLIESCNIYVDAASFITEFKLPYTMYVFRLIWRHFLIFLHNSIVYLLVVIYFKVSINWTIIFAVPGLMLVMLNLASISLLLSIMGAKYRDIPQVVVSIIQIAFFITPISWSPGLLKNSLIITLNPFNYFIDLVRSPLLGQMPSLASWVVSLTLTMVVSFFSFVLFARFRRNIPFWL